MTDREMLEAAARAYWGKEIDDVVSIEWDEQDECIAYTHADNQDHNGADRTLLWNPLADDGDEARLEAALQLHVEWHPLQRTVSVGAAAISCTEPFGDDSQKARRRAGVRAAAAMAALPAQQGE